MWDEAKVTFRSSNVSQNIVKYDIRHGLIWVENQEVLIEEVTIRGSLEEHVREWEQNELETGKQEDILGRMCA